MGERLGRVLYIAVFNFCADWVSPTLSDEGHFNRSPQ
jgi:hypothetical protein